MAGIVEIAKLIQSISSSQELPTKLELGQIGITSDTNEIFFGAGGHPHIDSRKTYPYKNVKILTELDMQYDIKGNVYYQGPVVSFKIPALTISPCFPLFPHNSRQFGNMDFSIQNASGSNKKVGTLTMAVHHSTPSLSNVVAQNGAHLNMPNDLSNSFSLSNLDPTGTDTGMTWLSFDNPWNYEITISITGRVWSSNFQSQVSTPH